MIEIPDKLRPQLERDEGRVNHVYFDTSPLKLASFGVGHMADPRAGGTIPDDVIDLQLTLDIKRHAYELEVACPWVAQLDPARLCVLINMAFNMGVPRLLKFVRMLGAVKLGRYSEAAAEMLDSAWARQVGARAHRLATQMETGVWT